MGNVMNHQVALCVVSLERCALQCSCGYSVEIQSGTPFDLIVSEWKKHVGLSGGSVDSISQFAKKYGMSEMALRQKIARAQPG